MTNLTKSEELEFKKRIANTTNSLQREIILEEKIATMYDALAKDRRLFSRKDEQESCMNTFKKYFGDDDTILLDNCCSCAEDFEKVRENELKIKGIFGEMVERLQPIEQQVEEKKKIPMDIIESIGKLRRDYPKGTNTAFIIMQFRDSGFHQQIVESVKQTLKKYGIIGLRADDKEYADDLFANVKTYMHGCDFGIAIFERITENDINPNVSLEVGYMMGIGKKVCFLKDQTLKGLQTDLAGKLYKPFSVQKINETIDKELSKWIKDKFVE